jgi:hypothetical protein
MGVIREEVYVDILSLRQPKFVTYVKRQCRNRSMPCARNGTVTDKPNTLSSAATEATSSALIFSNSSVL